MSNIWKTLKKPFTVLAPMDDVTDDVFRNIVCETARPDLFFTEFTNVEAICSAGRESQIRRFQYSNRQHPIIAQIWGKEPKHYFETTKLIHELGFDGVDINMGCPVRDVFQNGTCSAFIQDHSRAKEVISATQEAAGEIPVSVKTRIGVNKIEIEDWIGFLLEQHLEAITIHGRTVKELSKVPCHWDEIGKAVMLRNTMQKDKHTMIVGNGDVKNYKEALSIYEAHGVDGVMIGRGIFENLWAFEKTPYVQQRSPQERLSLLLKHARLFETTWGITKRFEILKKFFKMYCSGFPDAQELRIKLMETGNAEEIKCTLQEAGFIIES
ncbi:MAG: tRNA-dihydrouridine synthase [Patescibacteria group bacterium]